jgi:protein SCO1/2
MLDHLAAAKPQPKPELSPDQSGMAYVVDQLKSNGACCVFGCPSAQISAHFAQLRQLQGQLPPETLSKLHRAGDG